MKLYLDDLQTIADELLAIPQDPILPQSELAIEVGDYELEKVEDLAKVPFTKVRKLEIARRYPYVNVGFTGTRCWLYAANDDAPTIGTLERIRTLLQARRRPLAAIVTNFKWVVYQVTVSVLVSASTFAFPGKWPLTLRTGLLVLVSINFILFAPWFYWTFWGSNAVFLKPRAEAPTFLERNRDSITVAIIASILTGFVTFVAGYLVALATRH